EQIYFYKNVNGTFQKLDPLVPHNEEAKQVLWVDFDNDGDKDLYVATFTGTNRLYRNTGSLNFEDITVAAGLPVNEHRTFGACWGDFDRDGWLDLYYGERKYPPGSEVNENHLFRNNADGTFTEVTAVAQAGDPGKIPFCSAFLDYNNDKWPDLYTANDKLSINTLLENNGDGTFTDVSTATHADLEMDAMCVAVGDYDNDGWQDVYISDIENGSELLHSLGATDTSGVTFENTAATAGVGFYGIGWGSNFFDADNDGDLDLYVSGMLIGASVISSAFYQNEGDGTFSWPADAGFAGDTVSSFNNAIGDFNADGFPDIMVVNTEPFKAQLWQNGGGGNQWLKLDLEGVLSNRDGVGAKIEIFSNGHYQMRYKHCGIGFLGQNSGTEIIGLGSQTVADSIRITWPTGHVDHLYGVAAGQTLFVAEGSTTGGDIFVDDDVNLTIVANEEVPREGRHVRVFPNPVASILNVRLSGRHFSRFALLDGGSRVMSAGSVLSEAFQLDVTPAGSGAFFLVVWNEKGEREVVKVVRK
ncbi:MAG: CRTAC1 family protein, partial [Saprospiraceae bacterium]